MEKASPQLVKTLMRETSEFNFLMAHAISQDGTLKLPGFEVEIKTLHDATHLAPCRIPEHEHPFYELSFMKAGAMRYHCDGRDICIDQANKGIFLMPPATPHHRDSDSPYSIIAGFQLELRASGESGKTFLSRLPQLIAERGYSFPWTEGLGDLPERWRAELLSQRPLSAEKTAALVKEFLIAFLQDNFSSDFKSAMPSLSKRASLKPRNAYLKELVESLVEEKSNQTVGVEVIAASCGMSSRHLNRIFSGGKGGSLGRYMVERKMESAKRMLSENNLLLKDIARSLGYADTGYFCRVFKRVTGMTPRDYSRQAWRAESKPESRP